jgi:DmsE family decaheme c-type cytochrome
MALRIRKIGPIGWFLCAFLVWSVAFVSARASGTNTSAARPAPENSAALRKVTQAQVNTPRPAQTPATPAPPGTYAVNGEKTCLDCHDSEPATLILQTPHAVKADKQSPFAQHQCETCHGASPEHIADPSKYSVAVVFVGNDKSPATKRNDVCLSCHQSGMRTHWSGSQHENQGLACTDCHNVHAKEQKVLSKATQADVCFSCHKEQRAQTHRISAHPLAITSLATTTKMVCSDCHNPHGSAGPKLLTKNSVNDTCYTCHAEKRGPFLWEHAPVVDDCTTCHTPHGSANPSLLKTRPPLLCQQCHTGDHGAQINSGANLAGGNVTTVNGLQQAGAAAPRAQVAGRACLNCHVLIHGSNHPAGAKFQR